MEKVGRPTVMTEEVLQKLEEAFLNGASDRQAVFLANIAEGTLYNYIKDNPAYGERKELLKQQTAYKAKKLIKDDIERGKVDTAKWYAERKIKEEFSLRQELTGENGKDFQPVLVKFIDDENDRNSNRI